MNLKKESIEEEVETNDEPVSLAKLVKSWKPSDWESWLEEQETPSSEVLFDDPCSVENLSQESQDKFIQDTFDKKDYPALRKNLNSAIRSLTDKQQDILHLLFWENRSLKEVALNFSISTVAVRKIRDRALKKLGAHLLGQMHQYAPSVSKVEISEGTGVPKVPKIPIGREA